MTTTSWTATAGDDTLEGGAGVDNVSGGAGSDVASWADATSSVVASLDGVANDGVPRSRTRTCRATSRASRVVATRTSCPATPVRTRCAAATAATTSTAAPATTCSTGRPATTRSTPATGDDFLYGGTDSDALSYAGSPSSVYVYQDGLYNDGRLRHGERQCARHREADWVAVRRRPRGHAGR